MWDIIKTLGALLVILFLIFFSTNYFSRPDGNLENLGENYKELFNKEFPGFKEFWVSQEFHPLIKRFALRFDVQPLFMGIKQYWNNFLAQSSWREYWQEKEPYLQLQE